MSGFDFNDHSRPASEWADVADTKRKADAERVFDIGIPYLDDYTGGIFPDDLVLVGAETGVGKTTLVTMLAEQAAAKGKRVCFFALEAWPGEIESRVTYKCLTRICYAKGSKVHAESMRYVDWRAGRLTWIKPEWERSAIANAKKRLAGVSTYYRHKEFTVEDVRKQFLAKQAETDLFILDHVHYIDFDDPNENRALKDITKTLREVSQLMDKPVICVAHLRKKQQGYKNQRILPQTDDFHGSSDLTKIVTKCLLLAPARGIGQKTKTTAPTFMHVAKDRNAGRCPMVALVPFDFSKWSYGEHYKLGRVSPDGSKFDLINEDERPHWAEGMKA